MIKSGFERERAKGKVRYYEIYLSVKKNCPFLTTANVVTVDELTFPKTCFVSCCCRCCCFRYKKGKSRALLKK